MINPVENVSIEARIFESRYYSLISDICLAVSFPVEVVASVLVYFAIRQKAEGLDIELLADELKKT